MVAFVLFSAIALVLLVTMVLLLRGRPVPAAPACGHCRYCVETLEGSTCPECGSDLSQVGVFTDRRQPASRLSRLLVVILLAFFMYGPFAILLMTPSSQLATKLFGETITFNGGNTSRVSLFREASGVDKLEVNYPGHDPSVPINQRPPLNSWVTPQSILLTVTFHDGRRQDLLMLPTTGASSRPRDLNWSSRMFAANEDSLPQEVIREGANWNASQPQGDSMGAHTSGWLIREGQLEDKWDPAIFIAGRMVTAMQDNQELRMHDPYVHISNNTHALLGESGLASSGSGHSSSGGMSASQNVRGETLLLAAWIPLWLVILVLVLIPGGRRESWPLESPS